jgi:formyltetrahydrofolate-dependent phosphoribosylglycinamide formyltransferase
MGTSKEDERRDGLARLAVLISGNGTNLQAILDACAAGQLPAQVVVVVSNRSDAYGLTRAERAGVPAVAFPPRPYLQGGRGRLAYDADLARLVAGYRPDWVALAGWMRLLSMEFLRPFSGRVINLHPALPGQFPGVDGIARAYEAFRRGEITHTGVMVHFVPDEGVDDGPPILTERAPIYPEDTLETLEARVHSIEHRVYVEALRRVLGAPADASIAE